MNSLTNIFVVKTIPEGGEEKYFDQHVWDIFWQCQKYFLHCAQQGCKHNFFKGALDPEQN